jgi:hypothetical protein
VISKNATSRPRVHKKETLGSRWRWLSLLVKRYVIATSGDQDSAESETLHPRRRGGDACGRSNEDSSEWSTGLLLDNRCSAFPLRTG